jgi:hypothetical protein
LRLQAHEVLLDRVLRHARAIGEELLHVLLAQVRCETSGDAERDPALCQRSENLREPSGHIGNLDAEGHRSLAQSELLDAVHKKVRVAELEVSLPSRELRE